MKVQENPRVILVGLGKMGANHFRILKDHARLKLVGVVDPGSDATALAAQHGVRAFRALDEVEPELFDVAVVACPTPYHYAAGEQLVARGKSILMEKPICATSEEAERLLQLGRAADVGLWVGHVERFNPVVRKAKQIIDAGLLGGLIHLDFARLGAFPPKVTGANNVVVDLAVHDLDILTSLVGPARVLSSVMHQTSPAGVGDTAAILLTTEAGASATVQVSWMSATRVRTIRILGSEGICFVDYINQTCSVAVNEENYTKRSAGFELLGGRRTGDRVEFSIAKAEPLREQYEAFCDALLGLECAVCPADSGAAAVRLAEQAISGAAGSPDPQRPLEGERAGPILQ